MKQIDNRQKLITKSRAERTAFGKHNPHLIKEKARFEQHEHAHEDVSADSKDNAESQTSSKDQNVSSDSHQIIHPKVGRNDPCLCGSGKKYKKCCLNKNV